MLISVHWLKDFVDLCEIPPKEIGTKFTLGIAEVERVTQNMGIPESVIIAEVQKVEAHPNADKIRLVTFSLGEGISKKVVCGAPNVRVGLKTPYAPVGTTIPTGLTLAPKDIRGFISEGMLCSVRELGLGEDAEGIMELDDDAPTGKSVTTYLGEISDIVIDVDNKSLTHRPDLWGLLGIARECSLVFRKPLNDPFDEAWIQAIESSFTDDPPPIKPNVSKESSCLAYWGLSIDSVTVGPSPKWIAERLRAVGLKPINNIVDVSNYIMIELGIPLHIFDRDKIEGSELTIEKIGKETDFQTLDGANRRLSPTDTIIRDANKPLVLAGIMGGLNSGVSDKTQRIFVEAANWKAADIRKTSTGIKLRTDAGSRYEKSLDSRMCYRSLLRACELIKKLCPKARIVGRPEYDGTDPTTYKKRMITTSAEEIKGILGTDIPQKNMEDILQSLGFKTLAKGGVLSVEVPSFRSGKDIEFPADLAEEVGRIIGFDNIAPLAPKRPINPIIPNSFQILQRKIKTFLTYNGEVFETMTYPLIGESLLKKSYMNTEGILTLFNALSKDHDRMRPSLVPGMLQSLSLNAKTFPKCRFFELGKIYKQDIQNFAQEYHQLAILLHSQTENPFLDMVNLAERLFSFARLPASLETDPKKYGPLAQEHKDILHPFESYGIKLMGRHGGMIFSIHPTVLKTFKIPGKASVMLADLGIFENKTLKSNTKYKPLSKFPPSRFDYCLEVPRELPVAEVIACLKKIKIKEIVSNRVVDVYPGKDGNKYLTMRSTLMDEKGTLSGESIKQIERKIVESLETNGYPLKQG